MHTSKLIYFLASDRAAEYLFLAFRLSPNKLTTAAAEVRR
jgi:hypothetical protein